MMPTAPSSTLFPYTTLFRSAGGERRRHLQPQALDRRASRPGADEDRLGRAPPVDRKSTRLNSSHLGISYAVFCLKKKKKKIKYQHRLSKRYNNTTHNNTQAA